MAAYRCVICRKSVTHEGRWPAEYPFCSARCRWVDLGRWFCEQYAIEVEAPPEGNDEARPAGLPEARETRP